MEPTTLKDELREIFLFSFLTDGQLDELCRNGRCVTAVAGPVCTEGEPAESFYVLLDGGEVVISKRSGTNNVEIQRTSERGTHFGAITAGMTVYDVSVRVTRPSRMFTVPAAYFARFMQTVWPVAVHLLETSTVGGLRQRQLLGLQEKQDALATITAGLTHQLNNPAAATVRAVADLRDSLAEADRNLANLAVSAPEQLGSLLAIRAQIPGLSAIPALTPLEVSDREELIEDWLTAHGVGDGWRYAAAFVDAGLDETWLHRIEGAVPAGALSSAISWVKQSIDAELRIREVAEAGARIAALINGAKPYSQMDRSPYQCIDIHEMLRSTVLMFGDKIGTAGKGKPITLIKDLDDSLPELYCYPADLNQVWTNLIDNALYAMGDSGALTVRTRCDGDAMIRVEICDDGPGIPANIIDRIFTPFFTTKPVGAGPGLGLDLAWRIVVNRHGGQMSVQSTPGDTRFVVRLPLAAPAPEVS